MARYVIGRLLTAIPILLLVSFGVFMLTNLGPGDPALTIAGPDANAEQIAAVEEQYHLNDPLLVQYGYWLGDAVRMDFGESRQTHEDVATLISLRLPVTLNLVFAAACVGLLLGVPLGLLSGLRPGRLGDRLGRLFAMLGMAIPSFLLGIVLVIVIGVQLKWLPISGFVYFTESPLEWLKHMLLPAITLGLLLSAVMIRQLRASLLEVLGSNYVRAAWARGGTPFLVVGKHAFKNSAIPALTVFGFQIAALLGGSVIVEQIFALPGLGQLVLNAIAGKDVPLIQAVTLVFVVCQMAMTLVVDLSYGFLNPKLRVG